MLTRFDFGAVARWTTAWARLSCASGRPTCSTAWAADTATTSAIGSAMAISSLAGYAFAKYAGARGEDKPTWTRHMREDIKVFTREAIKWMKK